MLNIADVLVELCSLQGPAGFESEAAHRAKTLLEQYVDETWTDAMGNVIGVRRCGKEGATKLLFDAHIDEIGLIITGAEEGFLRFAALGGLDQRVMPAACIRILTEPPRFGVVCVMPPHVLKKEDTEKGIKIEDMYIDAGLSQDEAVCAVPPGTPAVIAGGAQRFGECYICGKALDDRAGFVSILRALEMLGDLRLDVDLYVIASVQEEVGTRGAAPGAFSIDPDYCVVVDVGHAKTNDSKATEVDEVLGGGVIISVGPNINSKLADMSVRLAKEHDIKYQVDVEPGGDSGTNARAIQIARGGVATAIYGIPLRYMHNTNEVASLDDIESAARLLYEFAVSMEGGQRNA